MRHGSEINPPNRFERVHVEDDFEHLDGDAESVDELARAARTVEYLADDTRSIVTTNDSPDIPFRHSLNPYRGCLHGCSYCYARPTHEYLGLSAGLDFETKIVVKLRAAELFRRFLARPNWTAEHIVMSGVTDCYQPAERGFRVSRGCVEVASQTGQPLGIITKNALVTRDLDLLAGMARRRLARVYISVTTLDEALAREMEPRTSSPLARLRAVGQLAAAGVPVGVMVAPVIPGLNDHEIPAILKAAAEAGARMAGYVMLRLPTTVGPVFFEWLERTRPDLRAKIESRVRSVRGGKLNESDFGRRMRGEGPVAEQIRQLFKLCAARHALDQELPAYDREQFRPPSESGQLRLF